MVTLTTIETLIESARKAGFHLTKGIDMKETILMVSAVYWINETVVTLPMRLFASGQGVDAYIAELLADKDLGETVDKITGGTFGKPEDFQIQSFTNGHLDHPLSMVPVP